MKVSDPLFVLEKIEKYVKEDIFPSRYREVLSIPHWKYAETAMEDKIDDAWKPDYDDSGFQDFNLWDTWGGYDRSAWFRTTVTVPDHFLSKKLAVKLVVGPRDGGESTAETLLYVNGHPVQGIDIWHEEALLDESLCRNKELNLALKAWSGVLNPPKFRTFKEAQLVVLDERTDRFYFMTDTLLRCASLLDENDLRRIRLTKLLNDAFKRVNFLNYKEEEYYDSIGKALAFMEEELEKLAAIEELKPTVYGVGHSHIDMAWLWRLNATREKASRTFSTVLNLMEQYPEYRFMHSSPQLYQFLKEDYPEIYERVKEKIKEGQWEITGGMWVEPDTNIPSGESLVRQFLYGKRFIKEEFGRETNLAWLPDVFGYSAALPQIMKKCGMKYFMTTKISWNQYNHFPYDTFRWIGIDGSEIFTHFITTPEDGSWFYTYNGHMSPEEVTGVWKNYKDKDKNEELLIAYGWGDGGGGPTREMLESSRVMKNVPGIPRVRMSGAEDYFERICENTDYDRLGKWKGELYFELHRGTYTSQAASKRDNRKTENLLHDLEFMAMAADIKGKTDQYPSAQLKPVWERVLLNQFHDILPGSSIRQVYEDTAEDYKQITGQCQGLLEDATNLLSESLPVSGNYIALYNTTGFLRDDMVCIPYGNLVSRHTVFTDENGVLPSQAADEGLLVWVKDIPSYGCKTLALNNENVAMSAVKKEIIIDGSCVQTPFYKIEFNGNGEITGLFDKENKREVGTNIPMNVFAAYEDKPQRFDAWDVDVYYKEKPYSPFKLIKREMIEEGTVRSVIRQVWTFNQSVLTQDMIIYADSRRIDFKTTVDWKEKQVFLKVYFPVQIQSMEATYEIQFGNIKRPTHTNTEWDFARFEVPGHRWADLSEGNYGVSVLNDCKYGWDIQGNVIGLSLIKSAVRPDETADRRIHEFTYSLYPHNGNVTECRVQEEAVMLNLPLVAGGVQEKGGQTVFYSDCFVKTDSSHIQIDTVKKAETGRAYIVRLFEFKNMAEQQVKLIFGQPVKKVVETNLCEEEENPVQAENQEASFVTFDIGNYEIKTFKVYFD